MPLIVTARNNETLDELLYRHTQSTAALEQTLELNPGLSLTERLNQGTLVQLPAARQKPLTPNPIKLWE